MQDVIVDFETYYDQDYSLKKMSTSEYVRDPRFEVTLLSIRTLGHTDVYWEPMAIKAAIEAIDWETTNLIGHNLQFDGFILHEHYGVHPAQYSCTLSAARCVLQNMVPALSLEVLAPIFGLGEKGGALHAVKGMHRADIIANPALLRSFCDYCIGDVNKSWGLYQKLWPGVPKTERRLIDWTIRAFCNPRLHVDIPRAQAALDETIREANHVIDRCGLSREVLRSDPKLGQALIDLGYEPPTKFSEKQQKRVYAFAKSDDGLKEMLIADDERVRAIGAARLAAKSTIDETRANRLIQMGSTGDGSLAVYLNYWGAHTGRWSGGNKMNLQNFRRGSELRKSIIAPPGWVIVVGDAAQIEARVNPWLAGEESVLQAFRDFDAGVGPDIYKVTASSIFGVPVDEVNSTQRFMGKTSRLGLQFGMGHRKYRVTLAMGTLGPAVFIDETDALNIVTKWRRSNPNIVRYWDTCQQMLQHMAGRAPKVVDMGGVRVDGDGQTIWLPSGRWLRYSGLEYRGDNFVYTRNKKPIYTYGGKLTENIVQAIARDAVAEQMLIIDQRYPVVSMSHDEIISLAPEDDADEALKWVLDVMKVAPTWCPDLPLNADGKVSKEYSK